jgi:hypothetical protein
VKGLISL